jgi:hypothetical protein
MHHNFTQNVLLLTSSWPRTLRTERDEKPARGFNLGEKNWTRVRAYLFSFHSHPHNSRLSWIYTKKCAFNSCMIIADQIAIEIVQSTKTFTKFHK